MYLFTYTYIGHAAEPSACPDTTQKHAIGSKL